MHISCVSRGSARRPTAWACSSCPCQAVCIPSDHHRVIRGQDITFLIPCTITCHCVVCYLVGPACRVHCLLIGGANDGSRFRGATFEVQSSSDCSNCRMVCQITGCNLRGLNIPSHGPYYVTGAYHVKACGPQREADKKRNIYTRSPSTSTYTHRHRHTPSSARCSQWAVWQTQCRSPWRAGVQAAQRAGGACTAWQWHHLVSGLQGTVKKGGVQGRCFLGVQSK